MFKKLLIFISIFASGYPYVHLGGKSKLDVIKKAIISSDYLLFEEIYNDPKFDKEEHGQELKKIASKVLKDRVAVSKNKSHFNYSKKDLLRIFGGAAGLCTCYKIRLSYKTSKASIEGLCVKYREQPPLEPDIDQVMAAMEDPNRQRDTTTGPILRDTVKPFFDKLSTKLLLVGAVGYSLYEMYLGSTKRDNSEKLRNAIAIKATLKHIKD